MPSQWAELKASMVKTVVKIRVRVRTEDIEDRSTDFLHWTTPIFAAICLASSTREEVSADCNPAHDLTSVWMANERQGYRLCASRDQPESPIVVEGPHRLNICFREASQCGRVTNMGARQKQLGGDRTAGENVTVAAYLGLLRGAHRSRRFQPRRADPAGDVVSGLAAKVGDRRPAVVRFRIDNYFVLRNDECP